MIEDLNPRTIEALSDAIATDIGGAISGPSNGTAVHTAASGGVGATASLFADRTTRVVLMIQNTGTDNVYIAGYDPNDAANTVNPTWISNHGLLLEPGQTFTLERDRRPWTVYFPLGGNVRAMEVYS